MIGIYKADLVVEGKIIVEIKGISKLNASHQAQALHYLTATGLQLAILINFGAGSLDYRRVIKSENKNSRYLAQFVAKKISYRWCDLTGRPLQIMISIRRAIPADAGDLSRIALAAKRYWGCPERWMQVWAQQLMFSPEYFETNPSWVAELDGASVAFYTIQDKQGIAWIENLWVLPELIG